MSFPQLRGGLARQPQTPDTGAVEFDHVGWLPSFPDQINQRRLPTASHQFLATPIEPPVVPAPESSWEPAFQAWIARRRYPASAQPFYAAPEFVPDVTQPVAGIEWTPEYPDFARTRALITALQHHWEAPSFVPDVTHPVTPLSWRPVFPSWFPPPSWHALQGPSLARLPEEIAVPLPVDELGWRGNAPDWIARRAFPTPLHQTLAWPTFVPDVTQPVAGMEWNPEYPDFARRRVFQGALQRHWDAPVFVPDVTQPVAGMEWDPEYPVRVARVRTRFFPSFAWEPEPPAAPAAPDLVYVPPPSLVRSRLRLPLESTFTQPINPGDIGVDVIFPDWFPPRRAPQTAAAAQNLEPITPQAPDLSWQARFPDLLRQPSHAREGGASWEPFPRPPAVEIDWLPSYPDDLRPPKRIALLDWTSLTFPTPAEAPEAEADETGPAGMSDRARRARGAFQPFLITGRGTVLDRLELDAQARVRVVFRRAGRRVQAVVPVQALGTLLLEPTVTIEAVGLVDPWGLARREEDELLAILLTLAQDS